MASSVRGVVYGFPILSAWLRPHFWINPNNEYNSHKTTKCVITKKSSSPYCVSHLSLSEVQSLSPSIKKSGWWLTYPSEKYESQIGSSSQLLGKIKNVPYHQSVRIFMDPTATPKLGASHKCDPWPWSEKPPSSMIQWCLSKCGIKWY